MATISQLTASNDFKVLVGSAALILPSMILGCHGCIGALANILPTQCCDLYKLCLDEKWQQAIELQKKLVLPNTTVCLWIYNHYFWLWIRVFYRIRTQGTAGSGHSS